MSEPIIKATFPLLRSGVCGGTGGWFSDPVPALGSTIPSDCSEGVSTDPLGVCSGIRWPEVSGCSAPTPATATSWMRSAWERPWTVEDMTKRDVTNPM